MILRLNRHYVLKLLIILSISQSCFAQWFINKEAMVEAIAISQQVIDHSDETTLIIGIGRSPSLVIETLKYLNIQAINLPLSSFKYNKLSDEKIGPKALPEKFENKLFGHFSNIFEGELINLSDYKKVILLDYSIHGHSILSTSQYMSLYFRSLSIDIESLTMPIVNKGALKSLESFASSYKIEYQPIILKKNSYLNKLFADQEFDDYAQYRSYYVKSSEAAQLNPYYKRLQSRVLRVMNEINGIKTPSRFSIICSKIYSKFR